MLSLMKKEHIYLLILKDKYYKPEIEEFHVGFEYEMVIPVGFTYMDFSNPDKKTNQN